MLTFAWRNIWRNRRRAAITMASVFFAVFACTLLNSTVSGLWEKMRDDMLRTQTGHIQIHQQGYWDDKVIDNFMTVDKAAIAKLEAMENIENVSPRVEITAMASYGTLSKGIAVTGISPQKEKEKSNLPIRVAKGNYLSETDDGILIGEGLADYLTVDVGDTLAFIGQGYHGASAAGLFPIRGLLKLPSIEMSNSVAYMTLPAAQNFIDMPNGYSGILIAIKDDNLLNSTMEAISSQLPFEVLPWTVTMEELLKTSASHKGMVSMIMLVMYLIVGFGIFGTVIMLTTERKREFAMLISLGMSRLRLKTVTLLELFFLTLTGTLLATAVSIPVTLYFAFNPLQLSGDIGQAYVELGMEAVMPMIADPAIFVTQSLTILIFASITFIYPIRKIEKLKITENR